MNINMEVYASAVWKKGFTQHYKVTSPPIKRDVCFTHAVMLASRGVKTELFVDNNDVFRFCCICGGETTINDFPSTIADEDSEYDSE